MTADVRWGILGTGSIAKSFASSLARTPGSRLVAVASRTQAGGRSFAERFDDVETYEGYDTLVALDLDVVYVATPQHRHVKDAALALDAGHHVLVEKPLALSSTDVRFLTNRAEAVDRLVIEAMWSYFNPLNRHLIDLAHSGELGELRGFSANCGPIGIPPGHRALDADLGGSFLWECLVYPLSLLTAIAPAFLNPDALTATGQNLDGANRAIATLMTSGSAFATLSGGIRPGSTHGARSVMQLDFEKAWVEVDHFYNPSLLRIGWVDGTVEKHQADADTIGFGWEIEAIAASVRDGTSLPPHVLPHRTRRNAELMELIGSAVSRWPRSAPSLQRQNIALNSCSDRSRASS